MPLISRLSLSFFQKMGRLVLWEDLTIPELQFTETQENKILRIHSKNKDSKNKFSFSLVIFRRKDYTETHKRINLRGRVKFPTGGIVRDPLVPLCLDRTYNTIFILRISG